MAVLKEKDKKKIAELLKRMENEVSLIMFTQEMECQHCEIVRTMLEELSSLSDKLILKVHDFVADAALAGEYGIDKIPAVILLGDHDYGIRFYGVPGGYEFSVLIEDILDVSKRDSGLDKQVKAELAKVDQPLHMQVITSPT